MRVNPRKWTDPNPRRFGHAFKWNMAKFALAKHMVSIESYQGQSLPTEFGHYESFRFVTLERDPKSRRWAQR
jgi:hypothetical protein